MKKILIITPHYPPSNLAAVHRSRLFAQHLPSFGWLPIILTVDEKHYEETLDWNLHRLLPKDQRIEKVDAYRVTKPRLVGDIGLRGFFQLRRRALELIRGEGINFVYIPVPSYYSSLMGPYLQRKTGVRYGIDYIDPWVHYFPGSRQRFSRHWWSTKFSRYLEPKAVKAASLITGVAEGYYKGVQERNPWLTNSCLFGAMPYGGEEADHQLVKELGVKPYLFQSKKEKLQLVYAGALLPKAFGLLENILSAVRNNVTDFENVEFHFIGTGMSPNDNDGYNVKPIAEKKGLWQSVVFEYPARIPYLDVLVHLEAASGVFILGSTEPHYTPSKLYQAILSAKPILAVLHEKSAGWQVLESSRAGICLPVSEAGPPNFEAKFLEVFRKYVVFRKGFTPDQINREVFTAFSAKEVTSKLADLLNKAVSG